MAVNPATDNTDKGRLCNGVVEVISSTCWYIPGKIHCVNTDFLVDSGSTYTIMDFELFNQIPEENKPELEYCDLVLRSANGELLKVHGQVELTLEIGRESFVYPVKIVSLGDKSAILGLDFMETEQCDLLLGKGVLNIGSKSCKLSLHKQSTSKCARIQVAQSVCIPPNYEMIISGQISHRHRNFDESVGTIEQIKSLPENTGLLVAKAVVNTNDKTLPVRIANFSDKMVKLDKGHTVALLHPVDQDNIKLTNNTSVVNSSASTLPNSELPSITKTFESRIIFFPLSTF